MTVGGGVLVAVGGTGVAVDMVEGVFVATGVKSSGASKTGVEVGSGVGEGLGKGVDVDVAEASTVAVGVVVDPFPVFAVAVGSDPLMACPVGSGVAVSLVSAGLLVGVVVGGTKPSPSGPHATTARINTAKLAIRYLRTRMLSIEAASFRYIAGLTGIRHRNPEKDANPLCGTHSASPWFAVQSCRY